MERKRTRTDSVGTEKNLGGFKRTRTKAEDKGRVLVGAKRTQAGMIGTRTGFSKIEKRLVRVVQDCKALGCDWKNVGMVPKDSDMINLVWESSFEARGTRVEGKNSVKKEENSKQLLNRD